MHRLMIVDDEVVIAMQLEESLTAMGYEVAGKAASGEDARKMAESVRPDLILMDIVMPGKLDGIDAAEIIKTEMDIPVIFLTAYAEGHLIKRAKLVEPFGYIVKPFHERELKATVEVALYKKEMERHLQEAEERFRTVADFTYDWEYWIGPDGKFIYVSPSCERITEYGVDEFLRDPALLESIVHPDDHTMILRHIQAELESNGVYHIEFRIITRSGQERWISHSCQPVQDAHKRFLGRRASNRDITKRKRMEKEKKELEAKLQQAQKMEAIGTLAGGVAHDFNNLLMTIQGSVSFMLYDIDSTHPHYELLTIIKDEVRSGAELTRQLLGYARKGQYYVQPMNLNELVERTSEAIGGTRREISVHRELADDLFAIEADQSQIEQVLLNLLINAADAMPGGRELILKTANVTDKDMKDKVYDPKPGNYVQLTVTDTGKGMDKETLERIFEPFFTTKEMGSGTGLGLASVYGIIKGHGGYIDVESELGRGTTFTVYLPATEKKVEETLKPTEQIVKGTETILLVDDEERVLQVGTKVLKRLGYTVLEARGGREAVEIYKENKDKIDLVLLDIVMPDMGGGEAYDRMKEINPDVKVLLSSGYDLDSEAREILARGCDAFMQKPFSMKELSVRIREILDKK